MQIQLNQDEITAAVEDYVRSQISIKPNQSISIDFTAGRGANGLTAALDISTGKLKQSTATRSVPVAVETQPEPEPDPAPEADAELTDEEKDPAPEPKAETAAPKGIFSKKNTSVEAPEETDEATPSEESDESDKEEAPAPKSIFSKKKAS